MKGSVVRTAQDRQIAHLIAASVCAIFDMMEVEISCRATAGYCASIMIACEHLPAHARGDRSAQALRFAGAQRSKHLGVAPRALDHRATDIDLAPCPVLPPASARLAHRDGDLMCRSL